MTATHPTTHTQAEALAAWAVALQPSADDLALARRALRDTVAVALAARDDPLRPMAARLPDAANWSAMSHVLDFDDLHMASTAHISAVCVPATLACGGDARAYLAGAGVMARLGEALGWQHYVSGWHATCTAGAPAAAVSASVALGLDAEATARAIALAVPAAGGVQRAFGTHSKALQVGFATDAGVRAARLAAAGASADPTALDQWMGLVGASHATVTDSDEAVPGGLAIKLFPCCYALQRPISAMRLVDVAADDVVAIEVRTPEAALQPLIHHRPITGLQAKFSLEYAVAATLLDGYPGLASFADDAVLRPQVRRLVESVVAVTAPGGDGLLDGELSVVVCRRDGTAVTERIALPPGAPGRPPTDAELSAKAAACGEDVPALLDGLTWDGAASLLARELPSFSGAGRAAVEVSR